MRTKLHRLIRGLYIAVAMAVGAVSLLPALEQTVFAVGSQVTSRSVKLSNSTPSATSVTYHVAFNSISTGNTGGIVIQFCGDTPIIGSTTCTTTTAADAQFTASPSVSNQSSTAGCSIATFTTVAALSTNNTAVEISNSTPVNFTTTPCSISFDITTGINPSNTASFYARIYTYASQANANAYTIAGAGGTYVDYGGVALSTVTQVSISATVQETLTFCVSGSTITGTCGGLTAPSLTIGTGSPPVLDTSGESSPAYTQLTTNANTGVTVRMKAVNACTNGGLSTAPPDIAGGCTNMAGRGASAATLSGGQWGMCVSPGAGVSADANYTDSGGSSCPTTYYAAGTYGMDGANVTGTYGDNIYTTAGAVSAIQSILNFAAKAATTTPAGVYQGNEILIATGTF